MQLITNDQSFPGQYFDQETGLHQNYFRDYDPRTGRYIEPDPIGIRGGPNPFAYAGNNPLARIDPIGLFSIGGDCCGKKDKVRTAVQNVCNRVDALITDEKLSQCIKKRCGNAKIECENQCGKDVLGYNYGFWGINSSTAHLCTGNTDAAGYYGEIAIHEWAHSCGWKHGGGGGVPGDTGFLP